MEFLTIQLENGLGCMRSIITNADVMKLVDMRTSKVRVFGRAGSSPAISTNNYLFLDLFVPPIANPTEG